MAPSAPNRRCFLQGIRSGGGAFFKTTDSVSVVERFTADATHPIVPGWYIEGTVVQEEPIFATGKCIDFPSPALVDFGPATLHGPATQTLTSGSGIKFCGLQQITGKFNVNSTSDGVVILPGAQIDGQWTMSVSANKSAKWRCVK